MRNSKGKTSIFNLLFEMDDSSIVSKNPLNVQTGRDTRNSKDSVDDQIDAFILKYEKSSIIEKRDQTFQESLKKGSLKFLLEADPKIEIGDEKEEAPKSGENSPSPAGQNTPLQAVPNQQDQNSPATGAGSPDLSSMLGGIGGSSTPPSTPSAPTPGAPNVPGVTPQPGDLPEPNGSETMNVTQPAKNQNVPNLDIDRFAARVVRLVNNYKNLLTIEETIVNRAKNFLDEEYGDKYVKEFLKTLQENYGISTSEFDMESENNSNTPENWAVGAWAGGTGGPGGGA